MQKVYSSVIAACLIMIAGLLAVSCGNGGNPAIPDDPGSSVQSLPGPGDEPGDSGYVPPMYQHLGGMPDYAPDEVLVVLDEGMFPRRNDNRLVPDAANRALALLTQHNLEIIRTIPTDWGTVYRLRITDGLSVPDKVAELERLAEIEIAEPNGRVHFIDAPYFPNDPLWENPNDYDDDPRSTVHEQFGPSKTGASYVWGDTTGAGMVVCIIDTGIQTWHEDLSANMWINEDEIPDNDTDDDGNGYIDDIYGWDTDEDDNDITDYGGGSYHGTGCSGVVASTRDNNKGCVGIAPGARLMGIRIGFNTGFYSAVTEGIQYAMDNGADVVSMSFITTNDSDIMRNAMNAAYEAGVILVAGAGNDDGQYIYYPCTWDSVVKVGATSPFSQKWAYDPIDETRISIAAGFGWGSTYGNGLEIMGFGEHYITTFGGGPDEYWDGVNDKFFGGTSNATPMVAAAFALLKSYYPGMTAEWYRTRLRDTADDVMAVGYDIYSGYGRMSMVRAIYGVDHYTGEEDPDGFVDVEPHGGQVIDSLNYASGGDYVDTEDLFKFTATETGFIGADLDIHTWGENLDIELYSDPSMLPQYLLDDSIRENHMNDSHELVGCACEAGETYYIRVFPAGPGDSTAYTLSVLNVVNYLDLVGHGSYDPGFVHRQCTDRLLGYIDLDVGFSVHLREMIFSHRGTMPAENLVGIHVYRDANGNYEYDDNDIEVGYGEATGTNRIIVDGMNDEINFATSPKRYFFSIDLSGIDENAEYELVLTDYKAISTAEAEEAPYDDFPISFGPFQVGVDVDPPTWDTTVGIQDVSARYQAAVLYWNRASDPLTPPVRYNVYWTQELPFDFGTANHRNRVSTSGGGDYDYSYKLNNLNNDEEYYVAVRAIDQANNEDDNTVYLAVTPSAASDPTAPQVLGSFNTAGNAWEVVADGANQRVFVADMNGGVLVIDVSDPTAPSMIDQVPGAGISGVEYDGRYVYAAGAQGLSIIDPDAVGGAELVSLVGFPDGLDCCVVGDWVYVSETGNSILPVDVSDPFNPVTYPTVGSGQSGYGMDAEAGYLYVATNSKPRVFDLSDPSAPSNTGADFGGNYAYEIDAMGDRLYVTYWFNHRFSIYTLADPAHPSWIGGFTSTGGYYASDITMYNGYLYFGTNWRHIECLNVDVPSDIIELGQVRTDGPDGLDNDGMFIYSAENEHGLKVIL